MSESGPTLKQASLGHRFWALALDWTVAEAITHFLHPATPNERALYALLTFFLEVALLTGLTGSSFGQRILGLKVVDQGSGRQIGFLPALLRSAMVTVVLPAIFTKDGRGYHDIALKTVVVATIRTK